MLLKRVSLEDFKRFVKLEREFGPGINVVKGPLNEIGKSTLLDGIVIALFENPKSTKRELERYTRWGSEHRCKTAIEFEARGESYLLEKDFEVRMLRLAELDTGEEWNTAREVAEKLRMLLGTNSRTLFESTCCIRQDQVSDIASGRKEIGESLEGIVTGGTEETVASTVVEKLDKQISALTKGLERPTRSPGPIADLNQRVQHLRQELTEVQEEVAELERWKVELVEVSHELDRVTGKLNEAGALLDKNKRRGEIEGRIGELEEDYDKIDTLIHDIGSLRKQMQETELALQAIAGFEDAQRLAESASQLRELEAKRQGIVGDLPKRRHELETAREQLKRNRLLEVVASRTSLTIGAFISIAGFLGIIFSGPSLAIGVGGLIYLVGAMWAQASLARQKTQISDLLDRIDQMEKGLEQIEEQEREILSQMNCGSVKEFGEKEKRHSDLVSQKEASRNQLRGKLGTQTSEQIERQRREIARMLAEERERLTDDLKSTRLSPGEYVKLEKEVESLRNEEGQLQTRKMECEMSIRKARFDAEDSARREEMLDVLMNALNREQRKLRVYEMARDFVSRARTETLQSATDLLQAETQKNFALFTTDKYKKVRVGEDSTDLWIYSEDKNDWVRPGELSAGTVDEFYLACRLALVRLIYGQAQPPLILDDPFVNFDEPRLAQTLEFLRKLSKEHQIIIFTLGEAYDGIAGRVIQLM